MDSLLQGIPHTIVYLDDVLITGRTQNEHCRNLETVLSRLTQAGLRLKRNKCVFFQKEVAYLGNKIDKQSIYPNGEKVRAIQNVPEPKNVQELRANLGLINKYGRFLPRLSTTLAALYNLLRKGKLWTWGERPKESIRAQ